MELMKNKAEDFTKMSSKILMIRALRIHFLSGECLFGWFTLSFLTNKQMINLQQYNFDILKDYFKENLKA